MSTKHTPGPWSMSFHGPHNVSIDAECGSVTVAVLDCEPDDREAQAAVVHDARLIAAAPELLEALEELLHAADERDAELWDRAQTRARRALSKANGETP